MNNEINTIEKSNNNSKVIQNFVRNKFKKVLSSKVIKDFLRKYNSRKGASKDTGIRKSHDFKLNNTHQIDANSSGVFTKSSILSLTKIILIQKQVLNFKQKNEICQNRRKSSTILRFNHSVHLIQDIQNSLFLKKSIYNPIPSITKIQLFFKNEIERRLSICFRKIIHYDISYEGSKFTKERCYDNVISNKIKIIQNQYMEHQLNSYLKSRIKNNTNSSTVSSNNIFTKFTTMNFNKINLAQKQIKEYLIFKNNEKSAFEKQKDKDNKEEEVDAQFDEKVEEDNKNILHEHKDIDLLQEKEEIKSSEIIENQENKQNLEEIIDNLVDLNYKEEIKQENKIEDANQNNILSEHLVDLNYKEEVNQENKIIVSNENNIQSAIKNSNTIEIHEDKLNQEEALESLTKTNKKDSPKNNKDEVIVNEKLIKNVELTENTIKEIKKGTNMNQKTQIGLSENKVKAAPKTQTNSKTTKEEKNIIKKKDSQNASSNSKIKETIKEKQNVSLNASNIVLQNKEKKKIILNRPNTALNKKINPSVDDSNQKNIISDSNETQQLPKTIKNNRKTSNYITTTTKKLETINEMNTMKPIINKNNIILNAISNTTITKAKIISNSIGNIEISENNTSSPLIKANSLSNFKNKQNYNSNKNSRRNSNNKISDLDRTISIRTNKINSLNETTKEFNLAHHLTCERCMHKYANFNFEKYEICNNIVRSNYQSDFTKEANNKKYSVDFMKKPTEKIIKSKNQTIATFTKQDYSNIKSKIDNLNNFTLNKKSNKIINNPFRAQGQKKIDNYLDYDALKKKTKCNTTKLKYVDPWTLKHALQKLPNIKRLIEIIGNPLRFYIYKWRQMTN